VPLSWRAAGSPPRPVQAAGIKEGIGITVIHPAEQGDDVIAGNATIRSTKTLAGKQRQLHLLSRRLLHKGMFVFQISHLPVQVKQVLPIEGSCFQGQTPLITQGVKVVTNCLLLRVGQPGTGLALRMILQELSPYI
jgi:hypothetical protein